MRYRGRRDAYRRKDGRCAWKGCRKPLLRPRQKAFKALPARIHEDLLADPFCSAQCCNAWWGIDLSHANQHSHTPTHHQADRHRSTTMVHTEANIQRSREFRRKDKERAAA